MSNTVEGNRNVDHGKHQGQQPERLADDLLFGAEAIADELGIPARKAFYLLERGLIPGTKCGPAWTASRRKLREHFSTGE